MKMRYLMSCAAIALAGSAVHVASAADTAAPAVQDQSGPEPADVGDIIVTAQRRNESVQKVPLTIQAFSGQTLSQLNVKSFDDLIKYTPNVTFGNNGPGQGNVFMRGLSAGFAGGQSSATIGNFPNVALYLDDQSMQFPSRNLDIYAADMERVEILEGPQGTLFGGGAEAGAVRYITNKPNLKKFEVHAEGMIGGTSGGAMNNNETLTLNVPVIQDKFAIRATVYNERRGGYIDNVYSNFTRSNADTGNYYLNIKPNAAGICPNGLPTQPTGGGFCTIANAGENKINNGTTAGKNFNPTTYTGGRIEAQYDINDDWNILVTESLQRLDAEGLSQEYPTGSDFQPLQPLQITSFAPSFDKDRFNSTSWTVHGQVGPLSLVYTGSYLDRHINNQVDYTNYSRTAYGIYYTCTGGATGFGTAPAKCFSPQTYWHDKVKNTHLSNEFRVSTPTDKRIRLLAGAFQETFKIQDVMNFEYKTQPDCDPANLAIALSGGQVCTGNIAPAPGADVNDPSVRDSNAGFGEDVKRGYNQYAFFGSVDVDIIPNVLTITGGTRYFHYKEYEVGSQYASRTNCTNVPNGECGLNGGTFLIGGPGGDHVTYHGFKSRASLNWHVNPTTLAYFTFSQGFRPGGFNRSQRAVAVGPDTAANGGVAQFLTPNGYAPDSLNNYEIGVKTSLFQRRLQVNLSAYDMDWNNVQFAFYAPAQLGNTTFLTNGPNYNIKGVELQLIARPVEGLTVQGTATYNHNKQTSSPCLPSNIATSPTFGQCITSIKGVAFPNPFGVIGATAAFSPKFQASGRIRYDRTIGDYKTFAQVGANYTGKQFNKPANYTSGEDVLIPTTTFLRYEQPAYTTVDVSVGVARDQWHAELFSNNLNNSHASTFTSTAQFIKSEVPLRPRTYGLRIGYDF
jgi:outer membrane receptor protein involved in Fe transport